MKLSAEYYRGHRNLRNKRGSANRFKCADCGNPAWEWSHNGGSYDNLDNYSPRCIWCHRKHDKINVGEENASAILKERDIPIIRDRSHSRRELAQRFGVTVHTIDAVRYGKTWKHVP